MRALGPIALGLSVLAALLSATLWGSFVGSPLGVVTLVLAMVALRGARRRGEHARMAAAAAVLSVLAIAVLPLLLLACTNGVSCV